MCGSAFTPAGQGPLGGISQGRYGRPLLKVSFPVPAACTQGTNLAAKIRLGSALPGSRWHRKLRGERTRIRTAPDSKGNRMKAVVYGGPREVVVKEVPDAKIEHPTRRAGQVHYHRYLWL